MAPQAYNLQMQEAEAWPGVISTTLETNEQLYKRSLWHLLTAKQISKSFCLRKTRIPRSLNSQDATLSMQGRHEPKENHHPLSHLSNSSNLPYVVTLKTVCPPSCLFVTGSHIDQDGLKIYS